MASQYSVRLRGKRVCKRILDEDMVYQDEVIEGAWAFNIEEKLLHPAFQPSCITELDGIDFTLNFVQKGGMRQPIWIKNADGLGMTMPDRQFSVNDVKRYVGARRILDVMDVKTQKAMEMTMGEWTRYYNSEDKSETLNVISLEISYSPLDRLIEAPSVVRDIDWVECAWPAALKAQQKESTNIMELMKYPKVQKYCLMSVAGCYTDFHVDFGGTSVWYHIIRGKKVFWLIAPTAVNLAKYDRWVMSGKQSEVFFADIVDNCCRVELDVGHTFFIPCGWIHAVYTPEDSLVFGGNFLHSYAIPMQLQVIKLENLTKVPSKFRYPFFNELLWYVLERYSRLLSNVGFLRRESVKQEAHSIRRSSRKRHPPAWHEKHPDSDSGCDPSDGDSDLEDLDPQPPPRQHLVLTPVEYNGLCELVEYLDNLPLTKSCVPDRITDAAGLLTQAKLFLVARNKDVWCPDEHAGSAIIRPLKCDNVKVIDTKYGRTVGDLPMPHGIRPGVYIESLAPEPPPKQKWKVYPTKRLTSSARRRRTRCKQCLACTRPDCQKCHFCIDMRKYGGAGKMKQCCLLKTCTAPLLPVSAQCGLCHQRSTPDNELMECMSCHDVTHPKCLDMGLGFAGKIPNSWDCPKCVNDGCTKDDEEASVKSEDGVLSDPGVQPRVDCQTPTFNKEPVGCLTYTSADDNDDAVSAAVMSGLNPPNLSPPKKVRRVVSIDFSNGL